MSTMGNLTLAGDLSECNLLDTQLWKTFFLFYYLAVIIAAIPTNAFSLYVSWKHIKQRNDLGVYLFNLALNDLTFTVGLSLWLDFLWRGVWAHGEGVCLLSVYCLFTNFYVSEGLLCCIVTNRYLAVVYPLKYTCLRKVRPAAAISVAIWALVICFNATTISWDGLYNDSRKFSLCYDVFFLLSENLAHVNITRFFLGFIVPVVIVFSFTWRTCVAVRSNLATKAEERVRISKLLTVVLLCILFCFGPVHVMVLLGMLFHDCKNFKWLFFGYKISAAMSSLNCLMDPLLYCFITRTGKANVKQVVVYLLGEKKNSDTSVV